MNNVYAMMEGRLAVEYADYLMDLPDNTDSSFWEQSDMDWEIVAERIEEEDKTRSDGTYSYFEPTPVLMDIETAANMGLLYRQQVPRDAYQLSAF